MPPCATHPHPKTAWREEKSDKKKEERIGAQLVAEIMGRPTDTATFAISDPIWRPSSLHLQPTWASQPRNCGGHDGRDHACERHAAPRLNRRVENVVRDHKHADSSLLGCKDLRSARAKRNCQPTAATGSVQAAVKKCGARSIPGVLAHFVDDFHAVR